MERGKTLSMKYVIKNEAYETQITVFNEVPEGLKYSTLIPRICRELRNLQYPGAPSEAPPLSCPPIG
jgi:hypothetical protein